MSQSAVITVQLAPCSSTANMLKTLLVAYVALLALSSASAASTSGEFQVVRTEANFWTLLVELLSQCNCTEQGKRGSNCIASCLKLNPELGEKFFGLPLPSRYGNLLPYVISGAARGLAQCQKEFKHEKWNCSVATLGLMKSGTLEQQYVAAIVAAGITHEIARACSRNESLCPLPDLPIINSTTLPESADCQKRSDNVHFALRVYRKYFEPRIFKPTSYRCSSKLGVKLVLSLSQWKRCWIIEKAIKRIPHKFYGVPELESVSAHLRAIYDKGCSSAKACGRQGFTCDAQSPNYCTSNKTFGSLGTKGRECRPKSTKANSCDKLCCGRGYVEAKQNITRPCSCKFVWCCRLECAECQVERIYHVCK